MNHKIIVLLLILAECLVPGFSFAQPSSQSLSEVMKPTYILKYEPASVLESGTDNILRITVRDSSVKRLLVKASQGTVKQQGEDFIVHPELIGEIILKIYNYNDLGNPVFIEERRLEVGLAPFATLAGKQGGKISKKELKQVKKVELNGMENTKISEFKLSADGKDIEYKEFSGKDENLTEEMISQLQLLPVGAKLFIEYIRAGKGAISRQIAPVTFTIVE